MAPVCLFLASAAASSPAVSGRLRLPGVPLALPAALRPHDQLPGCAGLVSADTGHQDQLHLQLPLHPAGRRTLFDLPRQPLLGRVRLHPAGLPVAALRVVYGGVLALHGPEPAAVQSGRGQRVRAGATHATGTALHMVEGHQLPLCQTDAAGDKVPQWGCLHHHAGVQRAGQHPRGGRGV